MTVGELIEELKKHDPELECYVEYEVGDVYVSVVEEVNGMVFLR